MIAFKYLVQMLSFKKQIWIFNFIKFWIALTKEEYEFKSFRHGRKLQNNVR